MSDIINNLKYSFSDVFSRNKLLSLKRINDTWHLCDDKHDITLNIPFKNNVVNLHINYIDLKHIAQNASYKSLMRLSEIMTNITDYSNKYIIYDIYTDRFIFNNINVNTWSEYIDKCLTQHYSLIEPNDDKYDIPRIIDTFRKISKKYSYIFERNDTLKLFNPKTNDTILPHPDGLIV
jgi:hypothetical protein